MNAGVRIPQGDDTVKVELTVKEIMALTGVKFHDNHTIEVSARKKLHQLLEDQYAQDRQPVN